MIRIERITSRDNNSLKQARRVRAGKVRDRIFVEGVRLAEEAVRSSIAIHDCFVSDGFDNNKRGREMIDAVIGRGAKVRELSERDFVSLADTEHPQGIVLICEKPNASREAFQDQMRRSAKEPRIFVLLYEANNPVNVGAILRTAEAARVSGVIATKHSADAFSPKALRASMGSAFRLPIWTGADFNEAAIWSRENGLTITLADSTGGMPYDQVDWLRPRMVVFGSEAGPIAPEIKELTDEIIHIPMERMVESLNLGVSAGIILFEAERQRRRGPSA